MKHGVSQNQNVNPCAQLERYQAATPFWWESRSAFSFLKNPQIWKYGPSCCLMHCRSLLLPRFLSSTTIDVSVAARPSTWRHLLDPAQTSHSTELLIQVWDLLWELLVKDELKKNLRERLPDVVELYTRDWLSVSILKELNFTCYSDEIHQSLLCIDQNWFIRPM